MALANFFPRAATAASDVLRGFDADSFARSLEGHMVGVAFDASAADTFEGKATVELAVNLLSRLYPRMAITFLGGKSARFVAELRDLAQAINPAIELASDATAADVALVVGGTRISARNAFYVGSQGWTVRFSPSRPVGSGATTNPLGASAAACFGAANIFRTIFSEQLPGTHADNSFSLSLLDFSRNAVRRQPPAGREINIGETVLVGIGAIGNAAVWALSRMRNLRGVLRLVDDEAVDLGNLQRYVLTRQRDIEKPKVAVAANCFADGSLNVTQHQATWGAYLRDRGDWNLRRVAVALDTPEDRLTVQAALPEWIVNAWTQQGDLGVSRHAFLGDQACLMCVYLPDGKKADLSQIVADAIGLSGEKQEVGRYLSTRAPVARDFIGRVAIAKGIPVERLLPFEGKPLQILYSEVACGAALLEFRRDGGRAARVEVPIAFQSALAGILLAGELVAHAARIKRVPPPVTTTFDLLSPLGVYLSHPRKKDRQGRCICQDPEYISAYQRKWASNQAPATQLSSA